MSLNMFPTLGNYLSDPAAQTQDTLTDNTGGAANTTLVEVTNTTSDVSALINANFADIAAQLAKVKTDVAAVRTAVVALVAALNKANGGS